MMVLATEMVMMITCLNKVPIITYNMHNSIIHETMRVAPVNIPMSRAAVLRGAGD